MSRLYANSPPMAALDDKLASFEAWLFIECFMIIFTFVALMIFLLFRALDRGKFMIDMQTGDKTSDFLAAEETELTVTLFALKISFLGTNLMLLKSSTIPDRVDPGSVTVIWI